MIIGTYRKTPISDRPDTGFRDPVARPINRSKVSALSGLQLLGMLLRMRRGEDTGPEILRRIFEKDGVFGEATDWRDFLNVSNTARLSDNVTDGHGGAKNTA